MLNACRVLILAPVVLAAGCGSSTPSGPTSTSSTPPAPSAAAVTSLAIAGSTFFAAASETRQLTAVARMSDGTEQTVTESATWESSRADVAAVSGGLVRAVAAGDARISAAYRGQTASVTVTVPRIGGNTRTVRILYLVPQDREVREDFQQAIRSAFVDLQAWYREQMGGPVFSLYSLALETCRLPRESSYYLADSYSKLLTDSRACAPVSAGGQSMVWVLYADVLHGCNAPGRLGVGSPGLTILGRGDLQGLNGEALVEGDCGPEPRFPVGRYIGGAGHELGHTFGLSHPPGCDAGLASCDTRALMWQGYSSYRNTYLRDDEKERLRGSPYFTTAVTGEPRRWDENGMPGSR